MKPIEARCASGLELVLRALTPDDRTHLERGWTLLSAESRFFRFHSRQMRLTDSMLDYLTAPDQVDHVAVGALCRTDGGELGVGVGRYVRQQEDPQRAEVAFTVIDAYQRKGVGTLLFATLMRLAERNGIDCFTLSMHAMRSSLIAQLRGLGATVRAHSHGIFEMELPFTQALTDTLQTLVGRDATLPVLPDRTA